jgi:hypothetical protein
MVKKSFSLVLLTLLMGAVISLTAQESAQNRPNPSPAVPQSFGASPLADVGNDTQIGGPHTLYQTFAKYNDTVTVKSSGYRQLDDATTVTCPGPSSCLIEFDQFVEVGGSGSENPWAIWSAVDGSLVSEPNGPWQGFVNFGGNYYWKSASGFQFEGSVSPGEHTVQTFVYSQEGVTVGIWALKYEVYEP